MKHRTRVGVTVALTFATLLSVALTACSNGSNDDGKLPVIATTSQIADLVSNVGGDRIDLNPILMPGSDPHGFEPRPSDVAATSVAALVFSNGLDLDPWAEQLVSDSGSEADLIDLSESLDRPGPDPHWWHDPRKAALAVTAIAEELSTVDPDGAAIYRRNAARYRRKIERLDAQVAACIRAIPVQRRKLVTDHEAFGHFAQRYGLEVVGTVLPALTTQAQPSARDLRELIEVIKRHRIVAIFPEASLNPKLAKAVAAETGANADHTLYGDALGPVGSDGATYLEMMAANAQTIVEGLGAGEVKCNIDAT